MPVRVKASRTNAWIIPETDGAAPHVEVAPVDHEIGRGEAPNPHRGQKRLKECGSNEDEGRGKFQQVEELRTVDGKEVPCEFSVEDGFQVDKTAEGVENETVKAFLAWLARSKSSTRFGIFDVCEELPKDAKIITTRWKNVPKGDKVRCWFVAREFRHDDPQNGLNRQAVDMHAVQHGYSILCLNAENAYFHAEEDKEVYCWPPKEWVKRCHARSGRVENPWCMLKQQLYGRKKAAKKFHEFVVSATVGLSLEQCPEQPSPFRRHLGARLKLQPNGSRVTAPLPPSDENEGRHRHHPHCPA